MRYLLDVAGCPFSPAVERDERLGLSRYTGVQIRRRLTELGCVRTHRVSTGRRSGQAVLLELTPVGQEYLAAAGTRIEELETPIDFRRRYYAALVAEYARRTWPEATIALGHEHRAGHAELTTSARRPDVSVVIPGERETKAARSIAFEIITTIEAGGLHSSLRSSEVFDELFLCTDTVEAAHALKREAQRLSLPDLLPGVTVAPLSRFLASPASSAGRTAGSNGTELIRPPSRHTKPETAFRARVLEAYQHLDDLDWLQDSPLARIEAVRERTNPLAPMPEAQALRGLLVDAALRAAGHAREVPSRASLHVFLERYVEGKRVAQIAAELGVTREWCSRAYRVQALQLAAMQFARLVAITNPPHRRGAR